MIRRNVAQRVHSFFITDDNFARNKDWEAILDRVIHLREVERMGPIRLTIQVDTQCHKIPNFIEKCRRANVLNMFVGLENINPDTLIAMKKRQNKIAEYRELFLAAKKARILTMAGYILGFPNDTPESILRDIEVIKRELPLDLIEFMVLTPLPGSEDHQKLAADGRLDGPGHEQVRSHPRRGPPPHECRTSEWEEILRKAWDAYYTPEHFETVMRRGEAFGLAYRRTLDGLVFFRHCIAREGAAPDGQRVLAGSSEGATAGRGSGGRTRSFSIHDSGGRRPPRHWRSRASTWLSTPSASASPPIPRASPTWTRRSRPRARRTTSRSSS